MATLLLPLSLAAAGNRACVPVDPTEPAAYFTGASASFGECWGPCQSELGVDGDALTLLVRGWDGVVFLDLSGDLAPQLTAAGRDRADAIAAALVGVDLEPRYGCPDCADGGSCTVSLVRDGVASTHEYDCSFGPPDVLADADAFWQGIIGDLADCRPNEYVSLPSDWDCVPVWEQRCTYDGQAWLPGDTFPATDGCNTCVCEAGGQVSCTEMACAQAAFTAFDADYGFCWGPCRHHLGVDGHALELLVRGWDDEVWLHYADDPTPVLTDAGRARAAELATALLGVDLPDVHGCPDCADGGACTLSLLRNGVASSHTYDCSGGAPEALAAAHEFWQGVVWALESCEPSPHVTFADAFDCVPLSDRTAP